MTELRFNPFKPLAPLGAAMLLAGCSAASGNPEVPEATIEAAVPSLVPEAARELQCAPAAVQITRIEAAVRQASGCGREVYYEATCDDGPAAGCRWQLREGRSMRKARRSPL